MKNKLLKLTISSLLLLSLASCKKSDNKIYDINIIYTSDVHCGITDNIGYSSFAAYKDELEKNEKYVTTIDCGDAIQGDLVGAMSNGKYIIDIMNEIDYDIFTLGNHEFDYGIDILRDRINEFNGTTLSANLKYIGKYEKKLDMVEPYKIIKYGKRKVAYLGLTAPETLVASNPQSFKEDGEYAYSFGAESKEAFYNLVQDYVDICNEKADYVVLLSHLGSSSELIPFTSYDVINNTNGIDVVLDGHAHFNIDQEYIKNKDNKNIPLTEVGTKLEEFEKITITKSGDIKLEQIKEYDKKSNKIDSLINKINGELKDIKNEVIATSNMTLSIYDDEGIRLVRSRETAIGNLVSDAYRLITNSDIGIVNGGGVRANIEKGDITFEAISKVHPYGNQLCVVKALGSEIRDYLEFTSRATESEYKKDGKAFGENGAFANVSGLKYTIDTSIPSSVTLDGNQNFKTIDGAYRVKDIKVLQNNEYVDLDLNKEYTIASHDFLLLSGGDGANMFVDNEVLSRGSLTDYQVLAKYIKEILKGDLESKYSNTEGRITIL